MHACFVAVLFRGVRSCRLRKLDLSHNQLVLMPNQNFWRCLPRLQVLLLHGNKIGEAAKAFVCIVRSDTAPGALAKHLL